ncbi:MAG: plastocyanin [Pseudomonadota bacterium]
MRHLLRSSVLAISCAAAAYAHAGNLQVTVTDKEGKPVQDAVVVLATATPGAPKTPLPSQITINQEKMRFIPALAVVGVGTKARFVNNDPWEHHVRASAAGVMQFDTSSTGGFELRMDGKAEGKPAKTADASFDKAGAVLLGCHLHASMRGYVYVSDSPWAAVTNADGVAVFEALPDGSTRVKVWHPEQLIDIATQQVNVVAAGSKAVAQLSVVPRKRRS